MHVGPLSVSLYILTSRATMTIIQSSTQIQHGKEEQSTSPKQLLHLNYPVSIQTTPIREEP